MSEINVCFLSQSTGQRKEYASLTVDDIHKVATDIGYPFLLQLVQQLQTQEGNQLPDNHAVVFHGLNCEKDFGIIVDAPRADAMTIIVGKDIVPEQVMTAILQNLKILSDKQQQNSNPDFGHSGHCQNPS